MCGDSFVLSKFSLLSLAYCAEDVVSFVRLNIKHTNTNLYTVEVDIQAGINFPNKGNQILMQTIILYYLLKTFFFFNLKLSYICRVLDLNDAGELWL